MSTTLDQLEAKAARVAAQHEAAQQVAQQARQQAEAEREERLREYEQRLLDEFHDSPLGQDIRDAQRALDRAVASDLLGAAWVQLKVAQLRRASLASEAAQIAAKLGDSRVVVSRPANSTMVEDLTRAVDRVAEAVHSDEVNARDAAAEG
jgi:hypothetical protein